MKPHSFIENLILFSIVLPAIFGCIRYRRLDGDFKLFLYYLLFGIAYTVFTLFRYAPFITNLAQSVYNLVENGIFLYLFFSFSQSRSIKKLLILFVGCYIVMTILEYCIQGVNSYRISITSIGVHLLQIPLGIYTATMIMEFTSNKAIKWARLLLVVPIVICSAADTYLDILMLLLYTPQSQPFFLYLDDYLDLLNLFTYLAFTISFLCLPRKKIFL